MELAHPGIQELMVCIPSSAFSEFNHIIGNLKSAMENLHAINEQKLQIWIHLFVLLESRFLNRYQNTMATTGRDVVWVSQLSETEAILKGPRLEGYILAVLTAAGATQRSPQL